MAQKSIKAGSTDQFCVIHIMDAADGTPEQAVEHDTSGLALWYWRVGGTKTAITPAALATLDAAHSDGGIEHIDDGDYRLDLPDATCAAGVGEVQIGGACTGMIIVGCTLELVGYDKTDGVRMGLTALPNAASGAAGGLPVSAAGSLDLDTALGHLDEDISVVDGKVDTIDGIVDSILEDTGTTLDGIVDSILEDTNEIQGMLPSKSYLAGSNNSDGDIEINEATGNYGGSVASVVGAVGSVTGNIGGTLAGLATACKAEVEAEVNDALVALNLDHLCKVATAAADMTAEVVDNSILSRVLANGDTSGFDPSTDGLQPVKDSLATAADIVDEWETQSQADPTGFHVNVKEVNGTAQTAHDLGAGVALDDDAITAAKFDESTAFPLGAADTGATAVARTGADSDTLETLSDEIAVADALIDTLITRVPAEVAQKAHLVSGTGDVDPPLNIGIWDVLGTGARAVSDLPTASEVVDNWETQSQADPTGFHVNVKEVNGTAQTANDNGADINAILEDTNELQTDDVPTLIAALPTAVEIQAELEENGASVLDTLADRLGTPVALDGGGATIAGMLQKMADDNDGADFDAGSDSLTSIRDRGDAAWVTGGGGSITDILNVMPVYPHEIDLADTLAIRVGLRLYNALDDLPSEAEITPGTISIYRKAIGAESWSTIVDAAACSEVAGMVYYDEVFDDGTGYAEGDTLMFEFKSQKITVSANDYEIADATNGIRFYSAIRQTMRGTDSAALATVCTEERLAELDAANLPSDIDDILEDTGTTLDGIVDSILEDTGEIGSAVGASISADIAAVKAETASILEDTGTTLDTIVDSILEDTAEIGAAVGASISADIAAVKAETAAILTDTGELGEAVGASLSADIAAMRTEVDDVVLQTHAVSGMLPSKSYLAGSNDADGGIDATEAAVINAQVVDTLNVDTYAEPGQEAPPATTTLVKKLGYLYKMFRNKKTNDGSTEKLYDDAGSTVDQKASLSEATGTVTKGEYGTGP